MALCLALFAFAFAPVPVDAKGDLDLPAPALGQAELYRLEVALLVFYGSLLLVTPAFSGLVRGRLPIEISTRGAKFADETEESALRNKAAIEAVERRVEKLTERLTLAKGEINQLKVDDNR